MPKEYDGIIEQLQAMLDAKLIGPNTKIKTLLKMLKTDFKNIVQNRRLDIDQLNKLGDSDERMQ
jgi:hypothetical protein